MIRETRNNRCFLHTDSHAGLWNMHNNVLLIHMCSPHCHSCTLLCTWCQTHQD